MSLPTVLELAKQYIEAVLPMGGVALDGTMGNGYDTLFLAQRVGAAGRVYAFDVQPEALDATHRRLESEGVAERVTLIHASHAEMTQHLPANITLHAAMYNLGYLPHGDKSVITHAASTLAALSETLTRLVAGGILTVVLYPGHAGGDDEAAAVIAWAQGLLPDVAQIQWTQSFNTRRPAPSLLIIGKR
jgi:predicted methyltransferase